MGLTRTRINLSELRNDAKFNDRIFFIMQQAFEGKDPEVGFQREEYDLDQYPSCDMPCKAGIEFQDAELILLHDSALGDFPDNIVGFNLVVATRFEYEENKYQVIKIGPSARLPDQKYAKGAFVATTSLEETYKQLESAPPGYRPYTIYNAGNDFFIKMATTVPDQTPFETDEEKAFANGLLKAAFPGVYPPHVYEGREDLTHLSKHPTGYKPKHNPNADKAENGNHEAQLFLIPLTEATLTFTYEQYTKRETPAAKTETNTLADFVMTAPETPGEGASASTPRPTIVIPDDELTLPDSPSLSHNGFFASNQTAPTTSPTSQPA